MIPEHRLRELRKYHYLGMHVDGELKRIACACLTDKEFQKEFGDKPLPEGWVAWHGGSTDIEALAKIPLISFDWKRYLKGDKCALEQASYSTKGDAGELRQADTPPS